MKKAPFWILTLSSAIMIFGFQNCMKKFDNTRFADNESSSTQTKQGLSTVDFVYPYNSQSLYFDDVKWIDGDESSGTIEFQLALADMDEPTAQIEYELQVLNENDRAVCSKISGSTSYPENHDIRIHCDIDTSFDEITVQVYAKRPDDNKMIFVRQHTF